MKINLVMIVKDEARCLARCLEKAALLVDDMIVVDTGSGDETRSIAVSMGARVWDYKWTDDFSAARNFALDRSDGDWNLVLDADEYLYPLSRTELEQAIDKISERHGAAWLGALSCYNSYPDEGGTSVSVSPLPRFLPGYVRYRGIIHEQPDIHGPCFLLPLAVEHDGYLIADKGVRNLPYLEQAVKEHPRDAYYQFQLAANLRNLKRLKESAGWFREFYRNCTKAEAKENYRIEGVLLYLYTLLDLGDKESLEEAGKVIGREEPVLGSRADFSFVCGLFYMKLVLSDVEKHIQLLPRIEASYLKCLSIGEHPEDGGVVGAGSFKAAYNLGTWYEVSGQQEKARHYYGLAAGEGYAPACERLNLLRKI